MILFAHLERTADLLLRISAVQVNDRGDDFAGIDFTIRPVIEVPPGMSRSTKQAQKYGVRARLALDALREMTDTVSAVVTHSFDPGYWLPAHIREPHYRVIELAEICRDICKVGIDPDARPGTAQVPLYPSLKQIGDHFGLPTKPPGAQQVRNAYNELRKIGACEAA